MLVEGVQKHRTFWVVEAPLPEGFAARPVDQGCEELPNHCLLGKAEPPNRFVRLEQPPVGVGRIGLPC